MENYLKITIKNIFILLFSFFAYMYLNHYLYNYIEAIINSLLNLFVIFSFSFYLLAINIKYFGKKGYFFVNTIN